MNPDHGANDELFDVADAGPQTYSLRAALDALSATESGLSFIYAALALLVAHFDLVDAVVVLEVPNAGTQIFRFSGKAVSKNFAARLGVVPGVYCEPRVVVADDLELVRAACQRELALHQLRLLAAPEPRHSFEAASEPPPPAPAPAKVVRVVENAEPLNVAVEGRRALIARVPRRSTRASVSRLLVLADVAALILTVDALHGPARFFLGLVLGVVIPGWSVVGLLKLENAALEIGLTMATSLTYLMLAGQILMTVRYWHPVVFEEFTGVICLPSLLGQAGIRLRRAGRVT